MGITLKEAYSISKKKSATKSTQFPLPKVLIANSKEYERMMELAYRHGLNTQVLHCTVFFKWDKNCRFS